MKRLWTTHEACAGLATGWALGLFEAGLVFSLKKAVIVDPMFWLVGPLAPMVLYGWCGLLLGLAFMRFGIALPLKSLLVGGAFTLVALRVLGGLAPWHWSMPVATAGVWWGWAVVGTFLWLWLGSLALRIVAGGQGTVDQVRAGFFASLAVFPLLFGMYSLRGTETDLLSRAPIHPLSAEGLPDIVLVTWDTVRADTLPLFGGGGLDTPNLDRIAAKGWFFDDFRAVSSITGPAHASILSGLYPPTHGQRSNGFRAPKLNLPRLPEVLEMAGYVTGGFVSGYALRGQFDFDRGFQVFDDRPVASPGTVLLAGLTFSSKLAERLLPRDLLPNSKYIPGEITLARALRWRSQVSDRPVFSWVHFYDAHHPYVPPDAVRNRVLARASEGPRAPDVSVEEEWVLQRGEIERLDGLLGELLSSVEEKDPGLKNTIVVLVTDHGECFGETAHFDPDFQYTLNHHYSLWDATQKVVCAIRPAGGLEKGRRVGSPASQVDLMPTLLSLAGLALPEGLQGVDLGPALVGGVLPDRGIYMEAYQRNLGDLRLEGWWRSNWKYVRSLAGMEALYPLNQGIEVNQASAEPERLAKMRAELNTFLANIETPDPVSGPTAEEEANLASLGYVGDEE